MIRLVEDGSAVVRWAMVARDSAQGATVGALVGDDFFMAWAADLGLACAWAVTASRSALTPGGVAVVGLRDWGGAEFEVIEFGPCFASGLPVPLHVSVV